MRAAQYTVRDFPDAELTVFYFGRDQGGGVDENIELWSKARWDERNTRRLADKNALDESRRFFEQHGL